MEKDDRYFIEYMKELRKKIPDHYWASLEDYDVRSNSGFSVAVVPSRWDDNMHPLDAYELRKHITSFIASSLTAFDILTKEMEDNNEYRSHSCCTSLD